MDSFFERYGRLIIVAVVVCFVLLLFTPMKNKIGDNINGFVSNFANQTNKSLNEVRMPGEVRTGDVVEVEGSKYIVLEQKENSKVLVMTVESIGKRAFQSNYKESTYLRPDGQNANTYENSEIDNYLENKWYEGLPIKMKKAVESTSIKQISYSVYNHSKQETGYNGQIYNEINRHVFLPSVEEFSKVVDLNNSDKVKKLINSADIWTRDSCQGYANLAVYLRAQYGGLDMQFLYHDCGIRPTFTVDLTKIDYKVVDTVNYK